MKIIHHYKTAHNKLLHLETEGGSINIQVGLYDMTGREVTSISFVPDQDWHVELGMNTRFIQDIDEKYPDKVIVNDVVHKAKIHKPMERI